MDFTPPGVGCSAVGFGFSFSGGGVEGDLVSSGIGDGPKAPARAFAKNVYFYQLEQVVSTRGGTRIVKISRSRKLLSECVILSRVGASVAKDNAVKVSLASRSIRGFSDEFQSNAASRCRRKATPLPASGTSRSNPESAAHPSCYARGW